MIAVIDYGAGNTQSVVNVLDELSVEYIVTSREFDINKSDKIIFPGVGEASFAMKKLHLQNLSTMLRVNCSLELRAILISISQIRIMYH